MKNGTFLMLGVLSCALLASCGGCSKDEPETVELCSPTRLVNVVGAPAWALERAGIAKYRYDADLDGGVALVDLVDEDDKVISSMVVRQLFGDPDVEDGSMEAVLDPDGKRPLRLTTHGRDVDEAGYTVEMKVQPEDGAALYVHARFDTVTCWAGVDEDVAPPCATGLPLADPAYTLPSCGLVADRRLRDRRPPLLTSLTYAVDATQSETAPTFGGARQVASTKLHQFEVLSGGGLADPAALTAWLEDTGLDELVGSEEERLLTTAFLDRTWWRLLDEQVAYCELERLREPVVVSDGSAQMSLCPSAEDSGAWSGSSSGQKASVNADPHMLTLDHHAYDFQAAGEFTLISAVGSDPFEIQVRLEPLGDHPVEACTNVSFMTAVATEIDGHRVTVRRTPEFSVWIDGEPITAAADVPELAGASTIDVRPRELELRWSGGETLSVSADESGAFPFLNLEVDLPAARRGKVEGLLGQFDGDPSNDYARPGGEVFASPPSFETLYGEFSDGWRITTADSLFDYGGGEAVGSFDKPGFPRAPAVAAVLPEDLASAARDRCLAEGVTDAHVLDACILDTVCIDTWSPPPASPVSSQPIGRDDLVVEGAIRLVPVPERVDSEPEVTACVPGADPDIGLFFESELTLEEPLEVEMALPGDLNNAPNGTLEAGTAVKVVHLAQPSRDGAFAHVGTVRFSRRVLGIIAAQDQLAMTDRKLGHPDTTYPGARFTGAQSGDELVLREDGRTLDITWNPANPHRLRVLIDNSEEE